MKNHLWALERNVDVSKINEKTKEANIFQNILKYYFVIYKLHISDFIHCSPNDELRITSLLSEESSVPLTAIIAQTKCRFICCAR